MSDYFMGEIRLMSFNFAPKAWAQCNGQFLPINQNQALFSLLGTTYGGNGQTTFALPNLRGQVPIHVGSFHTLGEAAGRESETITISQMPTHDHGMKAADAPANTNIPSATAFLAQKATTYAPAANVVAMLNASNAVGGTQPHENRQPFLTLNFCIALQGIFPSRN
jgi:microcystin-dependent protein